MTVAVPVLSYASRLRRSLEDNPSREGHSLNKGFAVTTDEAVSLSVAMIGALAAIIAAYIGRWGNDD